MSKKTAIKGKSVPSKQTLNLVIKEKSEFRLSRLLPAVLVVLALAAVFAKFAVLDRYAELAEEEAVLASEQAYLDSLVASYADYDEVQAEYNRYTYKDFDRTIPDRQDVLDALEKYAFPVSGMQQMSISGRSVSMTLTRMTLEQISRLIARLENDPLIDSVTVSTAGFTGRTGSVPTASITLALADATTLETSDKEGDAALEAEITALEEEIEALEGSEGTDE